MLDTAHNYRGFYMRLLALIAGLVLLSGALQAETEKHHVEEFLHVRFEGREAEKVIRSLDLPYEQESEGKGKVFSTADRAVHLYCFNRHYNVEPYACHFTFDLRGLSKLVTVKPEAQGIRLVLTSEKESLALYNALLVPEGVFNQQITKILEIENGDVIIDCRKDARRSSAAPQCSIFTTL